MCGDIVKSVMQKSVDTIKKNATIEKVVNIISKKQIKLFAVVNNQNYIVGIFNFDEAFNKIAKYISKYKDADVLNLPISKFMNKNIIVSHPEDNLNTVFEKMKGARIDSIVIVEQETPVGIASIYDLFDNRYKCQNKSDKNIVKEMEMKSHLNKDRIIAQLYKEIDILHSQSITDPLTGLFNVRHFNARIEEEVERSKRYNDSIGIIFIDIDHFKNVNDNYGHECGNIILKNIGKLLKNTKSNENCSVLRKSDVAVRYGGEEFIIICPATTKEKAYLIAERIRKTIEKEKIKHKRKTISITVSIGVSEFKSSSKQNIIDVIRKADSAMYEAKRLGRNRVIIN